MKEVDRARTTGVGKVLSAGLLKRPAGTHLDAECLAAFAENVLAPAERERAFDHLALCRDCREVLFLVQPPAEGQLPYLPVRKPVTIFRWVAVAASVVIVAGGIFLTRHELIRQPEPLMSKAPAPAGYVTMNEEKAAAPEYVGNKEKAAEHETRERQTATRSDQPSSINGRPELKHMTAKPHTKMEFDSTDQVRVANAAPSAAPQELPAQARSEFGLRDLAAAQPASAPPPQREGVKVQSEDVPRSTSEAVTVTGEAPAVQTQTAAEASTEAYSLQKNVAVGNGAGAVVGGFMKAPVAHWSLSRKGTLQRSFDQGSNWKKVTVNGLHAGFLAVASLGAEVWVGGKTGLLYHSADSGLTWTHVVPIVNGKQLSGDIEHVEFRNAQSGKVTTKDATWTTTDGGQSWAISNP